MNAAGLGIRIYTDEDVDARLAVQLRVQGYDIISASDVGNVHKRHNAESFDDNWQINFAVRDGRAILIHNFTDYARIDGEFRAQGREHYGIIMVGHIPIGELVRRTKLHLDTLRPQDRVQHDPVSLVIEPVMHLVEVGC